MPRLHTSSDSQLCACLLRRPSHPKQHNPINIVKSKTISGYVQAAVDLHRQRNLPNPFTSCGTKHLVTPLISSMKSYESVPDWREMIYHNMFNLMLKTSRLYTADSHENCILDWLILSRVTGARKSEWCQDIVATIPGNVTGVVATILGNVAGVIATILATIPGNVVGGLLQHNFLMLHSIMKAFLWSANYICCQTHSHE